MAVLLALFGLFATTRQALAQTWRDYTVAGQSAVSLGNVATGQAPLTWCTTTTCTITTITLNVGTSTPATLIPVFQVIPADPGSTASIVGTPTLASGIYTVQVRSAASSYCKARLVYNHVVGGCPANIQLDLFKSYSTLPSGLSVSPGRAVCASAGDPVNLSVQGLSLSQCNGNQTIWFDQFVWAAQINTSTTLNTPNWTLPANAITIPQGAVDNSSISFTVPTTALPANITTAATAGNGAIARVRLRSGLWPTNPIFPALLPNPNAPPATIAESDWVYIFPRPNAAFITSNNATTTFSQNGTGQPFASGKACIATNVTSTLQLTANPGGQASYGWASRVNGVLTDLLNTSQTQNVTSPTQGRTEYALTVGTAGCGAGSAGYSVFRSLVTGTNDIGVQGQGTFPTCFTPGATGTFQIAAAPNNGGLFTWTYPQGWTLNGVGPCATASCTQTGITATPTYTVGQAGTISAFATDCPQTGIVTSPQSPALGGPNVVSRALTVASATSGGAYNFVVAQVSDQFTGDITRTFRAFPFNGSGPPYTRTACTTAVGPPVVTSTPGLGDFTYAWFYTGKITIRNASTNAIISEADYDGSQVALAGNPTGGTLTTGLSNGMPITGFVSLTAPNSANLWPAGPIDASQKVSYSANASGNGPTVRARASNNSPATNPCIGCWASTDTEPVSNSTCTNCRTAGGKSEPKSGSLTVYPNPAKGRFSFSNAPIGGYQVFDGTGKLVTKGSTTSSYGTIDCPQLPSGIYKVVFGRGASTESATLTIGK